MSDLRPPSSDDVNRPRPDWWDAAVSSFPFEEATGPLGLRHDVGDAELRRLIERLELDASATELADLPTGLVDRVFEASVGELRRSAGSALPSETPSLRLAGVGDDSRGWWGDAARGSSTQRTLAGPASGRAGTLRRFGPALAMAACVGLAFVVALPSMTPLLRSGGSETAPYALLETSSSVEPVLAALLQRGADESEWRGVDLIRFSPDQFRPISPDGLGAAAPMAPIVETREASFSDFADEFARIRDAAKRPS